MPVAPFDFPKVPTTPDEVTRFLLEEPGRDLDAHGRMVEYTYYRIAKIQASNQRKLDDLQVDIYSIEAGHTRRLKNQINPSTGKPYGEDHIKGVYRGDEEWQELKKAANLLTFKVSEAEGFLVAMKSKLSRLPGQQGKDNARYKARVRT